MCWYHHFGFTIITHFRNQFHKIQVLSHSPLGNHSKPISIPNHDKRLRKFVLFKRCSIHFFLPIIKPFGYIRYGVQFITISSVYLILDHFSDADLTITHKNTRNFFGFIYSQSMFKLSAHKNFMSMALQLLFSSSKWIILLIRLCFSFCICLCEGIVKSEDGELDQFQ